MAASPMPNSEAPLCILGTNRFSVLPNPSINSNYFALKPSKHPWDGEEGDGHKKTKFNKAAVFIFDRRGPRCPPKHVLPGGTQTTRRVDFVQETQDKEKARQAMKEVTMVDT